MHRQRRLLFEPACAVVTSSNKSVIFDTASHSYELAGVRNRDRPGQPYIVNLALPPYEVAIKSIGPGNDATIEFDGFGSPDSGGVITIEAGEVEKTIIVDVETGLASVP